MSFSSGGGGLSLATAARIALRDLLGSRAKFLFIAFAIAVGVGSLAGVRGFGRAFRTMLLAEARTLMAADLMIRVFEQPTAAQEEVVTSLLADGAERTRITETVSMLSPAAESDTASPLFVSLKSVDPAVYPFYGEVKLEPAAALRDVLAADSIVVSEDVLVRLPVKVGDRVRVGEGEFRIAALVRAEPDRMTGSLNVGARVMLSREGMERTGLIKDGSRAAQRHLFRLDAARQQVGPVREQLQKAFPNALISDFRETHPLITRNLERSERFLSLIGLIALIVGALGVAATMHSHLQQRLDTIAIMKCLGARSNHVIRIFLLQTLVVGAAGGLAGVLIGSGVQAAFPLLIARFFTIAPPFRFDFLAAGEAMLIGLLTAVLFTLPALLGIERIRPLAILRRDVAPAAGGWLKPWAARLATLGMIGLVAGWLAGVDRVKVGAYFTVGLVVSLLILMAFAWLLLWLLRRVPRAAMSTAWRHGVANIHRPGNQAPAVLVSLGIGVMFTLTIYLIQHGMLAQILANAPPDMPNVFLVNITSREREPMQKLLSAAQGIQGKPELVPTIAARLATVNATPVEKLPLEPRVIRSYGSARGATMWPEARPGARAIAGAFWTRAAGGAPPHRVCLVDRAAEQLKIGPGARLTWTVGLATIEAEVACVYRNEEVRMGGSPDFVFSPGSLDHLPLQYFAALRLRPQSVAAFQRETFRQMPSVTIINGADVIEIIQQVVDQIALIVRFISAFAILAGAIILASSVAATRFRRVREVAILKTLGATRRRVASIFSVEFLILGSVAGLLGSLLATAFSNLLLVRLLEAKARVDWKPALAAMILSAIVANVAGWLASTRILDQTPLEVLRNE